jgi:hypothetical protein
MRTTNILVFALLSTLLASTQAGITKDKDLKYDIHTEETLEYLHKQKEGPNDKIYVHLIPHSHDDVGWLKTVDDYYTGTNNNYSRAKVHLIISNTVN